MGDRQSLWGFLILITVGFLIFLPAMHGGWLWDDSLYIVDNPFIHSPDGYWKAWLNLNPLGSHYAGNYNPLTTFVEWMEWRFWGNDTFGYHLVNVALHLTSALLLWRLFARLGFAFAWVGAMIFLVHPIQVESVAWISELKNTLSLPPLLMAMLAWLDYEEKPTSEVYRSALIWFALSLAAKSSGLMLPVILLGYVWWKRGTISGADVRRIAPFFIMSLVVGLIMLIPPRMAGAHLIVLQSWNLASCLASIGWVVVFLGYKCFWPVNMLPQYPGCTVMHPTAIDLVPWLILFAGGIFLVIGWGRMPWTRPVALGLGFFIINLFPLLVLVAGTYPEAAWTMDHLVYLPIIGLIGWVITWLDFLHTRLSPSARRWQWAGIGAVLLMFSYGSFAYAGVFVEQHRFWTYMLEREPQNWQTHDNVGKVEANDRHFLQAIAEFQKAVELRPDSDQPHYDLGLALQSAGKAQEAKEQLLIAEQLNPHEMRSYLALAGMMQADGNFPEAEKYIAQARLAAPAESTPLAALAALGMQEGRKQESFELYEEAIQMAPDVLELRYNYGVALSQDGQYAQAVEQLREAVRLNDNFAPARENLGVALAQLGNIPGAIEQFQAAVRINPDYPSARDNLGLAYVQTGRLEEAIAQFQKAIEADPNDATARASLTKLVSYQAQQAAKNQPVEAHP